MGHSSLFRDQSDAGVRQVPDAFPNGSTKSVGVLEPWSEDGAAAQAHERLCEPLSASCWTTLVLQRRPAGARLL